MQSGTFMHEVRAAGLANHLHIARIFLWGGLALALLSAMAWTPWLMKTGVLFTGIGVWIMWRVLKSLPAASPPPVSATVIGRAPATPTGPPQPPAPTRA